MADQTARPLAAAAVREIFRFRLWGGFGATRLLGDADVTPRGRKSRALLAFLLLERRAVDRERLAGLLWSERGEAQARASLRQCLLELRDFCDDEAPLIRSDRQQITLDLGRVRTDIDEMLALAEAGQADALADALAGGATLLEGMDGIDPAFDDWLRTMRAERADAVLAAAQRCARRALDEGNADAACRLTQSLQAMDPLDETVARLAMEIGGRLGRQDYVQRVYDRLAVDLARELGIAPSTGTRALRERLLNGAADRPDPQRGEAITPPPPAPPRTQLRRAPKRRTWLYPLAALLLVAGLALALLQLRPATPAEPASLAVLPFRNLAAGDDYFAEGVAEEILAQLSREPEFRVAGRTSSSLFKEDADLGEVRRRLDVDYVLEGSVRTAGDRVRVNVALVRTDDGRRLWTRAFDGRLDDIFRIQGDIGGAVAASLKRKLVYAGSPDATLRTSGEVYGLYLTARGLIRERDPAAMERAGEALRRAMALDPSFAPLWSSMAQVSNYQRQATAADRRRALSYAERALALAPTLAQAHGVLGMLNNFDTPTGGRHIKRAAALDPNNAEFQFWLGHVLGTESDFQGMLNAYRRAYEIDPLWGYAQEVVVTEAWGMGYRDEALTYLRRVERDGSPYQVHMIRAAFAGARGDFSKEAREFLAAREVADDPGKRRAAQWWLAIVLAKLRLFDAAYDVMKVARPGTPPPSMDPYVAIRQGKLPTLEELRTRDGNARYNSEDSSYARLAVKLLINAGRSAEIAALYDSDQGILQYSRRRMPRILSYGTIDCGPLVAVALREAGRDLESERILTHLDRQLAATLRHSGRRVPGIFHAAAAQTLALRGERAEAMAALEDAMAKGWAYASGLDDSSMVDFGDEPAFRSLRGDPRFERIRARLNAHLERERREVEQLRI